MKALSNIFIVSKHVLAVDFIHCLCISTETRLLTLILVKIIQFNALVENTGPGSRGRGPGVPGSVENTGSRGLWKTRGPGVCGKYRGPHVSNNYKERKDFAEFKQLQSSQTLTESCVSSP